MSNRESVNQYYNRARGGGSGPPFFYDVVNEAEQLFLPQSVKVKNTLLYQMFFRYYLQEIYNLFDFDGVPENWDIDYFKAVLYCTGMVGIIQAEPYGWIPQRVHFGPGRNVYGFPTSVLVCNPYFHPDDGQTEYDIATENALIKLNMECLGIADIAALYAYKKACIAPVVENSALISRNGWILGVSSKSESATLQAAISQILSGEIVAAYREKEYSAPNRGLSLQPFETDAQKHYLVDRALQDMKTVDDLFHNALGIGTVNRNKKERVITSEQETDATACRGNVENWMENLQASFQVLEKRSGIMITAKEKYQGVVEDESNLADGGDAGQGADPFRRVLSPIGRGTG